MASSDRQQQRHGHGPGSSAGMPQMPQQRDSHDLSLSPGDVTRDSLVANMLMSLDQFSLEQQNQHQFNHGSQRAPSSGNHSPGPQHRYHQFDGAPPWLPSTAPTAHTSASAAAASRVYENNCHCYRGHAHSYSSDPDTADTVSKLSSSPGSREFYTSAATAAPAVAATTNDRTPNSASSSPSQREELGIASKNLHAVSSSTPHRQQHGQHRLPTTPPSRGASLTNAVCLDRPSRAHRLPKHQQDSYYHFRTQTASSSASASSRRDSYRPRRSKSVGGPSTRKQPAAGARTTTSGTPAKLYPPVPSSLAIDYDLDYLNHDYAAAPTPTIPSGPRRIPAASLGGSASDLAPPLRSPVTPTAIERRRSSSRSLSLRSASGKNRRAINQQPPPPMPSAGEFVSAPAPSVGYRKAKEDQHRAKSSHAASSHHQHPDLSQQPPREKPGFFRRVFGGGGSRNVLPSSTEPLQQPDSPHTPSSPSPSPSRNERSRNERPPIGRQTKDQSKSASTTPSRDTSSSRSQQLPPVPPLQKKTSSFFRRRKKSVVNEAPPLPSYVPPVPLASLTNDTSRGTDGPSPVSSLRQALGPYLRNSAGSGKTAAASDATALSDITNIVTDGGNDDEPRQEFQRGFSPDYEPSPNAKIRSVNNEDEIILASPCGSVVSSTTKKLQSTASQTFLDLDNNSDDEHTGKYGDGRSRSDLSASAHSGSTDVSQKDTSNDDTIRASKTAPRVMDQPSPDTSRSRSNLRIPNDGQRSTSTGTMSTETDHRSATSVTPSVRVEDMDASDSSKGASATKAMQSKAFDEPLFVVGEPTEDDKLKAKKIYDGLEVFIPKDKAAAWMGEEGPVRKRTLQAYIELYSFTDQSILSALRSVCGRLILRAETQQVDRILVAFSNRWCDCNPNHGFKTTDVVHTICYSIMLLNTDLHVADIESKMTRSQFVKNTLSTIRQALHESNPNAFQRPSILPDRNTMLTAEPQAAEQDRLTFRHSFRPYSRTDTQGGDNSGEDSGPLVRTAFTGSLRAWEEQIEQVLKSIYTSIRDDRLPLFGAEDRSVGPAQLQSNLSVMGMLKRTPSVLSKAPSEGQMSSRGRITEGSRTSASRWASKSRSRPGLGRNGMASSRTSFDDDNSLWSPALSSATWSRYSLGRTQASMSQDSFASSMPRGGYQQSIGFANALSQSIIRDEDFNGSEATPSIISSDYNSTQLLEDESLELAGPPWIKEGMLVHKHHLDGVGKRAKDRNWSEVFAVVQKGQLSLFSFNLGKSSRNKARLRTVTAPVGGGNWQDNAVNVGTFNLRLTLASALPSPGYSRTRPYVWALSLPTGAVHLFQVGTPEIIGEFVNTANYWSARLSTHPLVGGISNVEYGWSEVIVNNALVAAINEKSTPPPTQTTGGAVYARKGSMQSASVKSMSFEHGGGGSSSFTQNSGRGKLPGDRIRISPWAPPTQSVRPSNLCESEQREALAAYVKSIEGDLQAHNQLRSPMLLAFTPRGQNAAKAMTNWERKSSYLLREIVKFRTYVDCMNQAERRKREVYKERDLARRAARGDLSDPEDDDDAGASTVEDDEEANTTLRPEQ